MLEQTCSVIGGSKIGSRVGTADLSKGVVDVAIKIHAISHLVHQRDVPGGLDDAAAAGDQKAALFAKALQNISLLEPERLLALLLKKLGDTQTASAFHQSVGIDKTAVKHMAEIAGQGRFAGTEKPHEEYMVASALDQVGHGASRLALKVAQRAALEDAKDLGIPKIDRGLRLDQNGIHTGKVTGPDIGI